MNSTSHPDHHRRSRADGSAQRAALAQLEPFSACSRRDLGLIDSQTVEAAIEPKAVLAREGDVVSQVIFVVDGRAHVTVGDAHSGWLTRGACLGGAALLEGRRHHATVRAETLLLVRVATPAEFRTLVAEVPAVAACTAIDRRPAPARPMSGAHHWPRPTPDADPEPDPRPAPNPAPVRARATA